MPSTVNGSGTRYIGKSGRSSRPGRCHACGLQTRLDSFDTRLYVVFLHIPIIPLGKKRIVDLCSVCTSHSAHNLHEWETRKHLAISGAFADFQAHPDLAHAIAVHTALLAFREIARADEFRVEMESRFNGSLDMYLYFATTDAAEGRMDASDAAVWRAYELRQDIPEVQIALGGVLRRAKRLTEAREMLDVLMQPGAGRHYPLTELRLLGKAFAAGGSHTEALELYAQILKESPAAANERDFRRDVRVSEKAAQAGTSILPERDRSLKALLADKLNRAIAVAGLTALLIAAGLIAWNGYIRTHRTVYILNGSVVPIQVSVDGSKPVQISGGNRSPVTLAEGRHTAVVTGAVERRIPFSFETGFFERWSKNPAFFLDPGGLTPVEFVRATYSTSPVNPEQTIHLGKEFLQFDDVDAILDELPPTLRTRGDRTIVKTRVWVPLMPRPLILQQLQRNKSTEAALDAAEHFLQHRPDDPDLLQAYVALDDRPRAQRRVKTCLSKDLNVRPVPVNRILAWQDLAHTPDERKQMAAECRAMLASEPDNPNLLYLAGRISGDAREAISLYEKGLRPKSTSAWPLFGLGSVRMSQGRWKEAAALLRRASDEMPGHAMFQDALIAAQIGNGKADKVEWELSAARGSLPPRLFPGLLALPQPELVLGFGPPPDPPPAFWLPAAERSRTFRRHADYRISLLRLRAMAASGKMITEGEQHLKVATASLQEQGATEDAELLRMHWLYMSGQTAALRKFAASAADRTGEDATVSDGTRLRPGKRALAWLALEEGQHARAEAIFSEAGATREPGEFLALTVSAGIAGDVPAAAGYARAAAAAMANDRHFGEPAAAIFLKGADISRSELDALIIPAPQKALFCAALLQLYPSQKSLLAGHAALLNADRMFPARLVELAIRH